MKPFRERNPVPSAPSASLLVGAGAGRRVHVDDLVVGGGDDLPGRVPRRQRAAPGNEVRVAGVEGRQGRPTSSWTATHVRVDFRVDEDGRGSAATPAPPSASRPCSARSTSRSSRSGPGRLPDGRADPARAHGLAVRRRRGGHRPRRARSRRSTPTQLATAFSTVADDVRRHPGEVAGVARRPVPAVEDRRPPRRGAARAARPRPRRSPACWPTATSEFRSWSPTATCCWPR